jgi:RimJ/RimL family protein N-acetyltransferase
MRVMSDEPPTRRHLTVALASGPEVETSVPVRAPAADDVEELAALMLDAYRGTIDADGDETVDVARDEVRGFMEGRSGVPHLEHSRVALDGGRIVSAVLVSEFEGTPLIAYVFTGAAHKGRGLAAALTRLAMRSLAEAGHERVHLWVTAGNTPAERIYERLGFTDAEPAPGAALP